MIQINHQMLERYLLGDLAASERERIEKEYFTSDAAWESLSAVENDLIDSSIRGRLSPQQQAQFQQYFLQSPRRRERFEFARLLLDPALRQVPAVVSPPPSERKFHPSGFAIFNWISAPQWRMAAIILLLAVGALLVLQNCRLTLQLEKMRSEQSALQTEVRSLRESAADANLPQAAPKTNETLEITQTPSVLLLLEPGNLRAPGSGNTNPIPQLPGRSASIVVALDLARDVYPLYSVQLQTADGHTVREVNGLRSQPTSARGRAVLVKFPSGVLSKGDYIVWLLGKTSSGRPARVDSYLFSVAD